ncbi:MAG: exodeoxyribonuclease VII large subunit [Kiritimatiellae bacterium]|nr:exodeoxyribonuclease VII large subunit [Kiritimatiellia bacterium]
MSEKKVFGVTELTRRIKATLEGQFGSIWLEGELSNIRQPASGHYYLTIKDEAAQISGVMFRGSQRNLKFDPLDGMLVRVFGEVSVYERSGNYQIIIRSMEESGKGALQARFEALKEKLQKEGLFDQDRKQELPLLPRHVGVVTSATGAAIRDIINVVTRRFSNMHVVLAPAKVQGAGAAEEISAAIDLLNSRGGLDVLIVGRGGGSIEDLWSFNEEIVARAIARSEIPVISAVGHEIDFTISDFVADMRAPTPSAAAELVVGRKDEFEEQLETMSQRLARACSESIVRAGNRLAIAAGSYVFREPGNLVRQYLQRLDGLQMRVGRSMTSGVERGRRRTNDMGMKALHAIRLRHNAWQENVRRHDTQLKALNPLAVLRRGYSISYDEDGNVVRSSMDLNVGRRVLTRVEKGSFESEVTKRRVK